MTLHAFTPAALFAGLALLAAQAVAADGAQAAVDFGCLNCHGAQAHSVPTFRSLADRAARRGDPAQALQHWLDEMHEKDFVHTHTMVSDDAAKAVLHWVSQGMK
jgi:mono/diheme cytochrome c family protein